MSITGVLRIKPVEVTVMIRSGGCRDIDTTVIDRSKVKVGGWVV